MSTKFPILGEKIEKHEPTKKKIAIVTMDLVGPIRNGGIGTAYTALAELLAKDGHEVTVIFANGYSDDDLGFHHWQELYRKKGIHLESIWEPSVLVFGSLPLRRSYAAYLMLKERSYDIVHFPDLLGIGYFCLMAKNQGIAFLNTTFCVILHGPTQWINEYNHGLPSSIDELQLLDFERKSVELADVLISPSQFAVNWAQDNGWKLPERTYVEHYVLPESTVVKAKKHKGPFKEIIFFGRLETRKGIDIFCDAIDLLPPKFLRSVRVTFLGRHGFVDGKPADAFLKARLRKWNFNVEFVSDLNQAEAVELLRQKNALVVIPSRSETLGFTVMECMQVDVPFIASDIPAFRELLKKEDADKVLFEFSARALKEKILDAFKNDVPRSLKFKVSNQVSKQDFSQWHLRHRPDALKLKPLGQKKVTVCVTTKDRPVFLEQAIESLKSQTYKNIEVILWDDASETQAAHFYLERLQTEFEKMKWKIVRSKTSVGPGVARNECAKLAGGDFILFMDDDNIAKPQEVETFLRIAIQTGADVVTTSFDRFMGRSPDDLKESVVRRWLAYSSDLNQNLFGNSIGDTNSLFKKSVFQELGGFLPQKNVGWEDFHLLMRAVLKGFKVETCPEALFWYRDHDTNFSKRIHNFKTLMNRLDIYKDIQGKDFRPIMSVALAWSFRSRSDNPEVIPPLVNPNRTNLLDSRGEEKKIVFDFAKAQKSHYKLAGKSSLKKRGNDFMVLLPSKDSKITLPRVKSKAPFLVMEMDVLSIRDVSLNLAYFKKGKTTPAIEALNLKTGLNRLRFLLPNLNSAKEICLSNSGKAALCRFKRLQVFEYE